MFALIRRYSGTRRDEVMRNTYTLPSYKKMAEIVPLDDRVPIYFFSVITKGRTISQESGSAN